MQTSAIGLILLLSLTGTAVATEKADAGSSGHRSSSAYRELVSVAEFGFGGRGIVGRTSLGELALREVVAKINACDELQRAVKEGTIAAKLYVLVGLRGVCDRAAYQEARQVLHDTIGTVTTFQGCVMEYKNVHDVVADIDEGRYDVYLQSRQSVRPMRSDFSVVTVSSEQKRIKKLLWAMKHPSAKVRRLVQAELDKLLTDVVDGTSGAKVNGRKETELHERAPTGRRLLRAPKTEPAHGNRPPA